MSDKQDKIIGILSAVAAVGVIVYMAMRKRGGNAGSAAPASGSVSGASPGGGNPYSGALGFFGSEGFGATTFGAGNAQPFGSLAPSVASARSGAMNGNTMFPLFGYAVTTSTVQGIAQLLQALMKENAAYQGFAGRSQSTSGPALQRVIL